MPAKWEYFYENFTQTQSNFNELFNAHLNERAADGWELVSAPLVDYGYSGDFWTSAKLIWRRYVGRD
jgi:hypothetical protein